MEEYQHEFEQGGESDVDTDVEAELSEREEEEESVAGEESEEDVPELESDAPVFTYEPKPLPQVPIGGKYEEQLRERIDREKREEEEREARRIAGEELPREKREIPHVTRSIILGEDQPVYQVANVFEAPEDRQLEECTSQYRNSSWLNTPERRVDGIYTDNIEYGLDRDKVNLDITWYPVSEAYFRLQCKTKSDKKSFSNDSIQFTTADGTVISLRVLYHFTDGTFALQDQRMYRAEMEYFYERTATPLMRRDLIMSRPFVRSDNPVRRVGRDALAGIPESAAIEERIANLPLNSNLEYIEKIASITAFTLHDSVFDQRLKLGYYIGVDVATLPTNEKVDYPQLREIYNSIGVTIEKDRLSWEVFDVMNIGEKVAKRDPPRVLHTPEIENQNTDGKKVYYHVTNKVYDIADLQARFKTGNTVLEGTEAEPTFVQKINRMNLSSKSQGEMEVTKPKLNIFSILKANLEKLRNDSLTNLPPTTEVCDYCNKHVGENSQFRSVLMDDNNQMKIVNFCSTKCFEKTEEE